MPAPTQWSAGWSGPCADPTPRLDALEELIEEFGPAIAALAVAEAYRGGPGG
jgi:hypothetical protein